MDESEVSALVLVGVTGDGKSSTGNTLSGGSAFEVSAGLASATQESAHVDFMSMHDGEPAFFRVVDTIGLQDTNLPAEEVMQRFSRFAHLTPFGIDAFLFVVRYGRFKPEHEAALSAFVANCGDGALEHTILLFTHCTLSNDDLTAALADSAPPSLRDILPRLGGGVVAVENVTEALAGRERVLRCVAHMRSRNGSARYSNAALAKAQENYDAAKELERAAFASAVADWRKAGSGPVQIVREHQACVRESRDA
mmetsp:Transcript_27553/g.74174  ORF Transcript_27553/g.74174 Transcript_27553/m.74174 type:complete len:253 (-) Transcript_27553:176-934(-)